MDRAKSDCRNVFKIKLVTESTLTKLHTPWKGGNISTDPLSIRSKFAEFSGVFYHEFMSVIIIAHRIKVGYV